MVFPAEPPFAVAGIQNIVYRTYSAQGRGRGGKDTPMDAYQLVAAAALKDPSSSAAFGLLQELYAQHPGPSAHHPHQPAGAALPPPASVGASAKRRKQPSAGGAARGAQQPDIQGGFAGSLQWQHHLSAAGQAGGQQPPGPVQMSEDQFIQQQQLLLRAAGNFQPPPSHPSMQAASPSGWASPFALPTAPSRRHQPALQEQVFTGTEPRADKRVPLLVDKMVPEAALYKRLLDVEELLERESAKQAWQIDDALRDRPSLLRTLRISVCNTHKNQPAMRSNAAGKQADSADGGQDGTLGGADKSEVGHTGSPEWTLHILGDALGVEQGSQKLSDFLEKVRWRVSLWLVVL
jgi:hypothetical protein